MKRIAIAAALLVSSAALTAALATAYRSASESLSVQSEQGAAPSWSQHEGHGARFAEGSFNRSRGGDDDDDRGGDDDDDDSGSGRRGGGPRLADPNTASMPVPDSGVFNGKARPKVEVQ